MYGQKGEPACLYFKDGVPVLLIMKKRDEQHIEVEKLKKKVNFALEQATKPH